MSPSCCHSSAGSRKHALSFGSQVALFLAFLLEAICGSAAPSETSGEFRAGASVVDISPTKLPVIVNAMFEERSADRVIDPLYARCLILDDGTTRIVFAVVDSCVLPRDLVDRAKELATSSTGIPVDRMLVSATHTHSAPSVMGCLGSRVDPEYSAWLPVRIAEAIIQAATQTVPARIGWAVIEDWQHTFNRRWIRRPDRMLTDPFGVRNVRAQMHPGHESPDVTGPSGPVDPALSVLAVQTLDGRPLALLANYSQHYYGSPLLSSDYYGRFTKHVAQKLSADERFVCLMSQGTSGDLMWMDYSAPPREIGYDAYAEEVASRALEAYARIEWKNFVPLAMAEQKVTLHFRVPDDERLAWARGVSEKLNGGIPRTHPEIYAREAIHLHERPTAELKLQAIKIGDLGIAAIPNEVFALTGLKIKARSPFATTFTVGLANGAEGYIPPPEQHKLGGYTTWPARTAGLVPEAEPKILETIIASLEAVAERPRRPEDDEHGAYARAVLDAKPAAYWRLNDACTPTALDATGHQHNASFEDGVALYLPGADAAVGIKAVPPPVPNAFSGSGINRAAHFAGGRLRAGMLDLKSVYSVELWLWNGLPNDARAITGYIFSRGPEGNQQCPGDHLGLAGTWRPDLAGKLIFFNGNTAKCSAGVPRSPGASGITCCLCGTEER